MPAITMSVATTAGHPGEGAGGGVDASDRGTGLWVWVCVGAAAAPARSGLSLGRLVAKHRYRRLGTTSRVKLERSTTGLISVGGVRSSRQPTLSSLLSAASAGNWTAEMVWYNSVPGSGDASTPAVDEQPSQSDDGGGK